ncbi:molybdopterin-guanine dinucleotide biosynthesis protein B [Methanocalculus taiwanensis]|uniref:Molybdopterin-guanine dinucleotide biosynthesis protein B n=1 Tax=Methanocalculus taiwanensis TaxID=106207 RepID=A0ABD4TI71_9EURY|nr:molybdopterin-guanine dinucleotide biosynthesis protein B [Methanocalculus taiwanensis]MCQ1538639.1 molybdopterin-guanine dinucleotide biosynthesis protein B [Methanocalculus taiwanensis]
MIVIHIFGRSNTGKTTLVECLCRQLAAKGRVETIKHSGHHPLALEEGKDTTLHFRAGASGTCAIDEEKSILILADQRLTNALDAASDRGAEYCIVEGFKNIPLPGIALGDLEGNYILMRNPTPEEVLLNLSLFPTWYTPKAVLDRLLHDTGPGTYGSLLILHGVTNKALQDVAEVAGRAPGITGSDGRLLNIGFKEAFGEEIGCLALVGKSMRAVTTTLNQCVELLSDAEDDRSY